MVLGFFPLLLPFLPLLFLLLLFFSHLLWRTTTAVFFVVLLLLFFGLVIRSRYIDGSESDVDVFRSEEESRAVLELHGLAGVHQLSLLFISLLGIPTLHRVMYFVYSLSNTPEVPRIAH